MKLYGKRPDTKDKLWKIWKYALGSYSDDKTAEYDDISQTYTSAADATRPPG